MDEYGLKNLGNALLKMNEELKKSIPFLHDIKRAAEGFEKTTDSLSSSVLLAFGEGADALQQMQRQATDLQGALGGVENIQKSASGAISGLAGDAQQARTDIGGLGTAFNNLNFAIEGIASAEYSESINNISEGVADIFQGLDLAEDYLGGIVKVGGEVSDLAPGMSMALGIIGAVVGVYTGNLTLIVGSLMTTVSSFTKMMTNDVEPLLSIFNDEISEGAKRASTLAVEAYLETEAALEQLAIHGSEYTGQLANTVVSNFQTMHESLTSAIEANKQQDLATLYYVYGEEAAIYEEKLGLIRQEQEELETKLEVMKAAGQEETEEYQRTFERHQELVNNESALVREGLEEQLGDFFTLLDGIEANYAAQEAAAQQKEDNVLGILRESLAEGLSEQERNRASMLEIGEWFSKGYLDLNEGTLADLSEANRGYLDQQFNAYATSGAEELALQEQFDNKKLIAAQWQYDKEMEMAQQVYDEKAAGIKSHYDETNGLSEKAMIEEIESARTANKEAIKAAEERWQNVFDEQFQFQGRAVDSYSEFAEEFLGGNRAMNDELCLSWSDTMKGLEEAIEESGGALKQSFSSTYKGIIGSTDDSTRSIIRSFEDMSSKVNSIVSSLPSGVTVNAPTISYAGIPGLAVGMQFVPANEFPALLHYGEAVLTYKEANQWRSLGGYEGLQAMLRGGVTMGDFSMAGFSGVGHISPPSFEIAGGGGMGEPSDAFVRAMAGAFTQALQSNADLFEQPTLTVGGEQIVRAYDKGKRALGVRIGGEFAYSR